MSTEDKTKSQNFLLPCQCVILHLQTRKLPVSQGRGNIRTYGIN